MSLTEHQKELMDFANSKSLADSITKVS